MNFFDRLYETCSTDVELFGSNYVGHNENFIDREWHRVAMFPKDEGGDGQPCEIWEIRLPARFYKFVALKSKNSVGEVARSWSLSTGSGQDMAKLLISIAEKTVEGMLGISN